MILSKPDLLQRLPEIIPNPQERDYTLINSASIDIRIGRQFIVEYPNDWIQLSFEALQGRDYYQTQPGTFLLISTYEYIQVPGDLVIELKLKSSRAREGWNHSLAFWVDPGWQGILTMEVQNVTKFHTLLLKYKQPFAQLIVHKLTTPLDSQDHYHGRYQGATSVERTK